ncbi:SDR family NAD(P)-dependent oxidoreductase [Kordia zhangzhouensis]|uniref:SDR family NAD(P)-dependent oxidoreductase n=1 Tax=Kordia zhangzhouensis TaxID=1620405 RepID=UPI0006298C64|nr:SDR family NAD(P)-dependent oxidoreductase [Kordia zhangzhouensis]
MNSATKTRIQNRLIISLADALYLEPSEIDADKSFTDLGLDSIVGVEWIKTINKEFDLELSSTKVYDYSTVKQLAGYVADELAKKPNSAILKEEKEEKVAPKVEVTPLVAPINIQEIPQAQEVISENSTSSSSISLSALTAFPTLTKKERKKQVEKVGAGFEDEKIAIVGISGRYPDAQNLDQYWENLKAGKNSIKEIPTSRWDTSKYYDPDPTKPGKIYCKWLGMLDDVDCFDPLFFQISPAEAESMDPQHRLFLEESYKAFEDAGYSRNNLSDKKCGVYMGIMSNEYAHLMAKGSSNSINTTANSFAIGSARISYFLNLKGPAIPFDTACSSSLVATHVACQGLLNNEIDMALAGGVSLYLIPESYVGMCQAGMLSPDGQCKTFDDSANGFVPGEGVGTLVLKRLKDAERDNDHIYGVIIGSGINQDGKTNGITAPSVNSQIELEREIYKRYNIDPASISYVEAHGTGTKLGDPIELEALSTVFKEKTDKQNFCGIGSVKTNLGHTSGAAGVASIHKVLLSMQHKTLVPSLNIEKENNIFDFKNSPFYISKEEKPWTVSEDVQTQPRRAAISSFGFSGTNAHLVIEEYPQNTAIVTNHSETNSDGVIVPISARTKDQLLQKVTELHSALVTKKPMLHINDIAYTLQVGREELRERIAIVVTSTKELCSTLEAYIIGEQNIPNVFTKQKGKSNDALNIFENNETLSTLVDTWIKEKTFAKLAEIWANGFELNWERFYGSEHPKRVALPTYPFAKERYWPEISESSSQIESVSTETLSVVEQQEEKISKIHFITAWQPTKLSTTNSIQKEGEVTLLLNTDTVFTEAYQKEIVKIDDTHQVVQVGFASSYQIIAQNSFTVNPTKEEEIAQLISELENQHLFPTRIIHNSLHKDTDEEKTIDVSILDNKIYPFFNLCKGLIQSKTQQTVKIISYSPTEKSIETPLQQAFSAFFKTLALENPKYQGKTIVFDAKVSVNEIPVLLANEFLDSNWHQNEIRYSIEQQTAQRYTHTLQSFSPVTDKIMTLPIKQQGVYLISGGIGGLGYIISEYLAKNFACTLILFGRSKLDEAKQQKLKELNSYQAKVSYVQTDVTNYEAVEKLIRTTKKQYTILNGIIHSAGVSMDNFLLKKSMQEIKQVINPKILGAVHLDKATKNEELDIFVLFSSIAGVLGNYGQADYAFANHFLDAFATHRNQLTKSEKRFGKTLSINWPFWEDGGFSLSETDIEQGKIHIGIHPIPTHIGLEFFEEILASDVSQAIALYGNQTKIQQYLQQKETVQGIHIKNHSTEITDSLLLEKTEIYLQELIGNIIKLDVSRLDIEEPFDVFGIDSIIIGQINSSLENDLGPLPKTLLYEYPTIKELAAHLHVEAKTQLLSILKMSESAVTNASAEVQHDAIKVAVPQAVTTKVTQTVDEPIAIIGIHGKYPKSDTIEAYWEHIKKGKNLIEEVPKTRWNADAYYDENPEKASEGKIYSKWGGFVKNVDKFDPKFFNISAQEAKMMDPQERLFLESVWATIEDAGYTKNSLRTKYQKGKGADVGVFVGVTTNTYNIVATDAWNEGNYLNSSALPWSIANRVSYLMDFQGPSMPIDTACSSSLVAIHLASESLKKGECKVAIAGGVNLYLHPSKYHSLCSKGMVAKGNKNYSFGAGDDGFVPGEGVGSVLLKPLSKAIEDNDHVYGIVKGSAYGHSGSSNGYSAPNPNSQTALIEETLQRANVSPENINYVEGHGTGTQLGDSLEILALTNAFRKQTTKEQFCAIGSVKANIGHSESAAGIAGLTKILWQLKHKLVAPTINSEEVNPNINFKSTPFFLQHQTTPWEKVNGEPRRALINSFGAGGVNSCIVVEEFENQQKTIQKEDATSPHLVVLSAKNKESLQQYANQLLSFLGKHKNEKLADIAYTLQVGREAMSERLAFIAKDRKELMQLLKNWRNKVSTGNVFESNHETGTIRKRFSKDEKEYLEFLLGKQSLSEIAKMWIEGAEVDWSKLHANTLHKRISLPTYPFTQESYWITEIGAEIKAHQSQQNAGIGGYLHPLVSHNISTLRSIGFESLLDADEYYAQDHTINGIPVFPGAGFIEMANVCGNIAGERKARKIKEVVWMHPLTFENNTQSVQTYLEQKGKATYYQIRSLSTSNELLTHSEGRIVFENNRDTSAENEQVSIDGLLKECHTTINREVFYNSFKQSGIEYGEAFQTIQELRVSDTFAVAKLKITLKLKKDFEHYLLHPSIFDGAMQTVAGLLANTSSKEAHVPFAIDEIEMIRPLTSTCYVIAEFADIENRNRSDIKKFNIKIVNKKGTLLVAIQNFYARAMQSVETTNEAATL